MKRNISICHMKFQKISLMLIMSIKTFGVLFVACLLILTAVAEITVANKWIPSDTMCNCTVLLVIIWFDLLIPSDKTRKTWNSDIAPRGIQPAHIWISMLAMTTYNIQTLQIYHNEETSSLPSSEIACISNQSPNHCTQTRVHSKCHEQMTSLLQIAIKCWL